MKLTRWLPTLERLETREMPAVIAGLSQTATWADLGPNNITGGQVRGITTNSAIGAVSALVAHPTDPNIMFASGTNGGVWRTLDAQASATTPSAITGLTTPTWAPLTDQLASLSVSDIAFDPDNPNRMLVGIGATADQPGTTTIGTQGNQEARIRGDRVGVLYSADALASATSPSAITGLTFPTWTVLNNNLAGRLVTNVVLRAGYMVVATDSGTFRSTDAGATFANVYASTLDNGLTFQTRQFDQGAYDVAENPRLRDQLYLATKPGAGLGTNEVWRSDDGGASWGTVSDPRMQLSARTVNVQVSVRDFDAFDNQVYVAVSNSNPVDGAPGAILNEQETTNVNLQYAWENRAGNVSSVCYSPNYGGTWIRLDAPRQETDTRGDATVSYDATTGVVTVVTGVEHRLQTGDKVHMSGFRQLIDAGDPPNGVPPTYNPAFGFFDFYDLVDVVNETTFTLRTFTLTGGLGIDSNPADWSRVVGASPGENPEFLQIQASRTSPFRLYLGGDMSQWDFSNNGPEPTSFTGSVWEGNWNVNPTGPGAGEGTSTQWTTLTDVGTNNGAGTMTAPGGDTRELTFDAAGNLWIATGTGVYRRTNLTGSGNWVSANGNLSIGQFYDAVYDTISNVVVGATQDTGAIESSTGGSNTYRSINGNGVRNGMRDQEVAYESVVDDRSFVGAGYSVRYTAANDFSNVRRREILPNNNLRGVGGDDTTLNFADAFTTNTPLSGINGTDLSLFRDPSARIVMELSSTNPRRAVYGLTNVYEDADPNGVTGFIVRNVTPAGMNGRVRTMKYGGQRPGGNVNQLNQVLAFGTSTGQLWVRGEVGPTFNNLAPGTGEVTDIEFDPDDWRHMFVAQGGRVYETSNINLGLSSWVDVTAGLVTPPLPGTDLASGTGLTTEIRAIALFDPTPGTANVGTTGDVVLLVGGRGGVFRRSLTVCGTTTVWSEYGSGMPNSVVTDLNFDKTGTRLTAATFGRGVWSIPDVRPTLNNTLYLDITGDNANDTISIFADPLDPNAVIVSDGVGPNQKFTFGQFDQIRVNANGGSDTVRVGNPGGTTRFVNYPITVNMGGDAGDTLIVESNGSIANIQATITPTTIGAGVGDTIFSGCGSLTYSGLGAGGTLDLRTGSGDDVVIIAAGVYPPPILTNTGAGNDVVFLNAASTANVFATDGAGVADILQVSVPAGLTVFGSPSNVITAGNLTVTTNGGFETYNFIGEGTGAAVSWGGGNLDDDFFLTADPTPGYSRLTVNSRLTPSTFATQLVRFINMNALTVSALAGNDRLIVGSNGVGAGSTAFINYQVNALMGGDAGDTLIVDTNSTTTPVVASVSTNSVGAATGDTIFGANGRVFYNGLVAGGTLEVRTGSGNDQINIFSGTYPHVINTYTAAGDDTVLIDGSMTGTVNAIDSAGTNDVVQILVPSGASIFGSPSRVIAVNNLRVGASDGIDSYLFTGLGAGGYLNWDGSGQDDDFFLTSDGSGVPGESQLVAFTPRTSPLPQRARFTNMLAVSVTGGLGNDRLIIDSNGPQPGSSAKFVTYHVNAFLGGDTADALIVDDSSTPTATRTTVTANSVAAQLGVDTLFGTNGRLFYTGAKTLHLFNGTGDDVVVYDTSTALIAYQFGGTGSNLALISGSGGDDTVNVYPTIPALAVNSLVAYTFGVQRFQVVGNGGTDRVNALNLAANTSLVVNQSEVQSGEVGGAPVQIGYQSTEELNLFAGGGTNNLLWQDVSNTVYGSPTIPQQGVEFMPRGPVSGTIRLAGGAGTGVNFHGVNGEFKMNGDANSTNTGDVLTVHGVSTAGQAVYGESTSSDGSDTIVASEDGVTVNNAILGALRSVVLGRTANNIVGFGTVWVRGGNETGTGDAFTAVPTFRTNLLLDGGDPSVAPGDSLTVLTTGPSFSSPSTDPAFGPPHTRITNRPNQASVGYLNIESVTAGTPSPGSPPVPSLGPPPSDLFAVGSEGLGQVNVYNLDGNLRYPLIPFAGYNGPIRVAVGDVTGDGKADVVVAPGPGSGVGPLVKVYNGQTGQLHYQFFAYPATFGGGVTLAVGYFNNDQYADIVTGAGPGGGPQVNVFDGASNAPLRAFMAFSPDFSGGVNVATGDVNGDGISEIITAPVSGSTLTRVFDGVTIGILHNFNAFPGFTGGVSVAGGDLTGDGRADIIVGAGPGGGPHVKAFDGVSGAMIRSFFVNDPNVPGAPPVSFTGGVTVAASDINGDGLADILTGRGRGFRPFAQYFNGLTSNSLLAVNTFGDSYSNGIFVGA